jgi:UDP-galactose transporter B1
VVLQCLGNTLIAAVLLLLFGAKHEGLLVGDVVNVKGTNDTVTAFSGKGDAVTIELKTGGSGTYTQLSAEKFKAKDGSVLTVNHPGIGSWLFVSVAVLGAHKFGLMALEYITFPMQVVCKSCKAIPVMLGEMAFGQRHPLHKKVSVVLMCAGVVLFTMMGKKKKAKAGAPSGEMDEKMMFGLLLIFLALVMDGIYGPFQNKIKAQAPKRITGNHLMFNINLWEGVIATVMCLAPKSMAELNNYNVMDNDIVKALEFCAKHPEIYRDLLFFSGAMGLGAIFITQLQCEFGALTVTTTTTMRKLISVLLSVFMFGHSIAPMQWAAIGLVVFSSAISKAIFGEKKKAAEEKPASKKE